MSCVLLTTGGWYSGCQCGSGDADSHINIMTATEFCKLSQAMGWDGV